MKKSAFFDVDISEGVPESSQDRANKKWGLKAVVLQAHANNGKEMDLWNPVFYFEEDGSRYVRFTFSASVFHGAQEYLQVPVNRYKVILRDREPVFLAISQFF